MIKQLKTSLGVVAGLAALSLGGAAIAGAAAGTTHPPVKPAQHAKHESIQTRDTDQVQSGDQTTPDTGSTGPAETSSESARETSSESAPEMSSESAPETSSETAGETAAGSDGPGGHADEPGSANANTQQQGQN